MLYRMAILTVMVTVAIAVATLLLLIMIKKYYRLHNNNKSISSRLTSFSINYSLDRHSRHVRKQSLLFV